MSVPTALLDGLNALDADAADVNGKTAAKAVSAAAVAAAVAEDTNNAHDLTAATGKQQTDLDAYIALLRTTYGVTP
jgi:hypothetical protein